MAHPRDEHRARRPPGRPRVEGLEIRLALSGDSFSSFELAPFPDMNTTTPNPDGEDFGGAFGGEETTWDDPLTQLPPPSGDDLPDLVLPGGSIEMTSPFDGGDLWFDDSDPSPSEGDPILWDPTLPGSGPLPPLGPPPVDLPIPLPTSIVIDGVEPGDGAEWTSGELNELAVHFSLPLSMDSLVSSDFTLDLIGTDGQVQQIFGPGQAPTLRLSGDGSTVLLIPDQPLAAGTYRLTLSGNARFVGVDGGIYDGDGTDVVLSEFRVVASEVTKPADPVETPVTPLGPTLSDAISLGTVGPELVTVAGSLNLNADPTAVALYRIELGPDHFWRLGLEVSADRAGSPLLSRLSLFDAEGRLLRTGTLGMADAPSDPFLFEGLEPGIYYVGLSGAGNDPSLGGYDPVTGALPVNLPAQQGGDYSLALVADVADAPTQVVGIELDRADPADPVPTGLTIHFDGVVRLGESGISGSTLPGGPIILVDASGKVWKTGIVSTNTTGSSVSVVFHDRLPRGRYEVRLAESGGLVDLVGRDPVAEGQDPGVLGRFEVTTEPTSRRPNDLGVLLPARSLDPVEQQVSVVPGSSSTVRFVVAFEANYALTLNDPGGGLTVELIGPNGRVDLGASPRTMNGVQLALKPGSYIIRVVNPTGRLIDASLNLRYTWSLLDSVPLNGVGQGPALGMRLAAPAAGLPQVGFDSPSAELDLGMGEVTVSPIFQSPSNGLSEGTALFSSTSEMAGVGTGMPVGPMLTPEIAPVGFPTTEPLRIVAIHPDRGGALAATASLAEGADLGQLVPIGVGQAVNQGDGEARRLGGPMVLPTSQAETPLEQAAVTSPSATPELEPLRPVSSEAIDDALAMLAPSLPWLPESLNVTPEVIPGGQGNPSDPQDEDSEEDRTEVSLMRALGIGLAVGWTARVVSRRQHEKPPGQIRVLMSESGVRVDDPEHLESVDELIRRHPGSPVSNRGTPAERNR
ncbi:hypothetical protein [Tautonia marina]|uniref:hypothetical protein n=1 Tax=Tautonia marina TaxID=2653855 RepID=UPI001260BE47|nr:hypothetical protein [Tautonia marina]